MLQETLLAGDMKPTKEQQMWFLKHHAWNLLDQGMSEQQVLANLQQQGVPQAFAMVVVHGNAAARKGCAHSDRQRQQIIQNIRHAIEQAHPDPITDALDPACDDDRTVYKVYESLNAWLYEPYPIHTWAAFGLSKMLSYGDWPLMHALQYEDAGIRYVAAFALGTMGGEAANAIAALEAATRDVDELVRTTAVESLRRIRADL